MGTTGQDLETRHSGAHQVHPQPEKSAAVTAVATKLATMFHLDLECTRVNFYKADEFKPLHHDKHCFDEDSTIWTAAASFGGARHLALAHPKVGNTMGVVLEDGDAYGFGAEVNRRLLHGVPKHGASSAEWRISVVIWGKANVGPGHQMQTEAAV